MFLLSQIRLMTLVAVASEGKEAKIIKTICNYTKQAIIFFMLDFGYLILIVRNSNYC